MEFGIVGRDSLRAQKSLPVPDECLQITDPLLARSQILGLTHHIDLHFALLCRDVPKLPQEEAVCH